MEVNGPVKQLVQYGHNSVFLVQRLQAREEPQQEFEGPPIASVQGFLAHWTSAIKDLLCNLALLIIGVKHSACDEGYLEWLLDDTTTYQYTEYHLFMFAPYLQLHHHRCERLPYVFIFPVLCCELCDMDGVFLDVSWRAAVHVFGDLEQIALDSCARWGLRAVARVTVLAAFVVVVLFESC